MNIAAMLLVPLVAGFRFRDLLTCCTFNLLSMFVVQHKRCVRTQAGKVRSGRVWN